MYDELRPGNQRVGLRCASSRPRLAVWYHPASARAGLNIHLVVITLRQLEEGKCQEQKKDYLINLVCGLNKDIGKLCNQRTILV